MAGCGDEFPVEAALVVDGDDPQVEISALTVKVAPSSASTIPSQAYPALQHAADSKWCIRPDPLRYAAAYSVISATTAARVRPCPAAARPCRQEAPTRWHHPRFIRLTTPEGSCQGWSPQFPGCNLQPSWRRPRLHVLFWVVAGRDQERSRGVQRRVRPLRADRGERQSSLLMLLMSPPAGANKAIRTSSTATSLLALLALNDEWLTAKTSPGSGMSISSPPSCSRPPDRSGDRAAEIASVFAT